MSKEIKNISRRKFLGQASCAALGTTTFFSSLLSLKALNAAAISNSSIFATDDYKALVCIFLSGGNDSYNMLIPRSNPDYNQYANTRSNLAVPQNEILPINPINGDGREFGVHPSMGAIQQLFEDGKVAFLNNVGTLIEPVTKEQFWNDAAKLPLGLFSHADQIQQWQTALPHKRSAKGWGGRMADLIRDMNDDQSISMNISLSGTNVFQTGLETVEFTIDAYNGSQGIWGYQPDNEWDMFNIMRTQAIDNMIEHEYQDIFKKSYADVIRTSRDAHLKFQDALEGVGDLNTYFSDNYISQSFKMIARTIAAREALGMKRQIFFIDYGGWDHHDEVTYAQMEMLTILSNAMGEFYEALGEINVRDFVNTFSISEFARTLTSNGNGSDHAWGGNVMVMGDNVNGKRFYGEYPTLALNHSLELGDGVLIPTTSADQYFAELALWFGVSPSDLGMLFPNLENFYNIGSPDLPLGFLNV